jgi:hypothetical protein
MFTELRRRYPQACLISELLTFNQGKYVVRVSVQNDGVTMVTGMAAAETIEQAEDQARARVMGILGELPIPTPHTNNSVITPPIANHGRTIDAVSPIKMIDPVETIAKEEPPPPESPETTDITDIKEVMAKTEIELRRLGWSVQQGRNFLLERYNKRARTLLTDQELLDFLAYLEAQP